MAPTDPGGRELAPRAARLGPRLREERMRLGLSARALAARAGLAHVTVAAIERGREASADTLRALLGALPGLRPESVLGGEAAAPATAGLWRAWARLHGFEARLARLDAVVRADGRLASDLVVEGLRPTRGTLADRDRRLAVLGAPLVGAALELAMAMDRHPSPAGRRHVLRLGSVEHSLWLPRRLDGGEARYRRRELAPWTRVEDSLLEQSPHGRPFTKGACAWIDHPVRRLVLRVAFARGHAPETLRILAWPATLATAPGEDVSSWPALYPHAPRLIVPTHDEAVLVVDLPPPGTCFALTWDEPAGDGLRAASPLRVRPLKGRPLPDVLREARESAGLTRRALARRMNASPASIVEAERGRAPRLELLARAVRALPGLTAAELFAPASPESEPDMDELRAWQVRVFGLLADSEECEVAISREGDASVEIRRSGLRWLGGSSRHVRVRLAPPRGLQTGRPWSVEGIDARGGDADPTVRVVSRDAGPTVHELRFLAGRDPRPLTHVRRLKVERQVAMRREAPGATLDERGRRAEAVYVEPTLPSRLLRLRISLPRGYWPDEVTASVVPRACGPAWRPEDLAPLVHPDGLRLAVDPGRRRLVLEVDSPLVGLRYQVLWFLA